MSEGYNGYPNRATWLCQLWIDNEESTQKKFEEIVRDTYVQCIHENGEIDVVKFVYHVALEIRGWVIEQIDTQVLPSSGLVVDLLTGAVEEINYQYLANLYLEGEMETRRIRIEETY